MVHSIVPSVIVRRGGIEIIKGLALAVSTLDSSFSNAFGAGIAHSRTAEEITASWGMRRTIISYMNWLGDASC